MSEKLSAKQYAEQLLYKPEYAADKQPDVKEKAAAFAEGYKNFLDHAKTEREAAATSEQMLADMLEVLGDRRAALCRELTKLHEEVRRTTLGEAAAYYAENPPRGEFVLVVAGAEEPAEEGCTFEGALALVRARMDEGLSTKDAVKQVAKLTGFAKNQLYDAILKG